MSATHGSSIRIPEEYARHLSELAAARRTTAALVEEALALLFSPTPEEVVRGPIDEHGPSTLERTETLAPEDIIEEIPIPLHSRSLIRDWSGC